MKKQSKAVLAMLFFTAMSSVAVADWQVIYSEDFSSDPGWITNNSANYHWDESTGSYFQREIDGSNEYAYIALPALEAGYKWRLEYDLKKTFSSGTADARFGFYDSDMANYSRYNLHVNQYTRFNIEWNTTTDTYFQPYDHITESATDNIPYHILLEYDPVAGNAYARVNNLTNGSIVGEVLVNIGQLQNIDRIAMSTIADQLSGTGESYIDNVVVMQVPEPATCLLVGLGTLGLLRPRKL